MLKVFNLSLKSDLSRKDLPMLVTRSISGQLFFVLFCICLLMIPLSLQTILIMTTPFWTSFMAYFLSGELIVWYEVVGMLLCFAAVCAITMSKSPDIDELETDQHTEFASGVVLALIISWGFAGTNIMNRKLKNVHFSVILICHSLCGIALCGVYLVAEHFATGDAWRHYSWNQYGWMLLVCCIDFVGLNSVTIAYQKDSSGFISLVGYSSVVYAFMVDYLYYGYAIGGVALGGAILILGVVMSVSVVKLRES